MAVRTLSINLVTLLNVAVESATVTLSLMANDQTGSSTVVISSSTAVTDASGNCSFSNVIPNVDGSQDRRYHCTGHDGVSELFNVEFQMPDANSDLNDLIDAVASDSNRIPYLDANQTFTGINTFGTPAALKTTVFNGAINLDGNTITDFLDQDDMSSNSASAVSSQQSIKSYVDSKVATVDSLAEVLALGNTTGGTNIVVTAGDSITANTISETSAASGVTVDSVLLKDNTVTATTFVGALTGNASTVTTNANLTGDITSTGNATSIASGVIVNADVKSDAAIAYSKLGTVPTWNQNTSGNAATVTTNANLTGDITSTGNATSIAAGVIINADVKSDAAIAYSKLGTIPTWNQNTTGTAATVTTNANLTGDIISTGNATSIASGVIINADIKSDAAIEYSKFGTPPTWNQNTTGTATTVTTANQPAITGLGTIASLVATTADINDGTIDALIGATSPDAGTFTAIKANTSLELATGATVTGVDNGTLGTSATLLATQGAIKTYVDSQVDTVDTLAEVLAIGNTSSGTNVELSTTDKVQFRDSAIYLNSSADGQLDIVADTEIQIAATTIDINGAINASGEIIAASLDISGNIDVDGITNLDVVDIDGAVDMASTLGVTGVVTANAGVVVDNFTLDGTTLALSSGDMTLDVAGSIKLDADSGEVDIADGGTVIGRFRNLSSNFRIQSVIQDKDIQFVGNDNGSDITALTLDMEEAGYATFNNYVKVNDRIVGNSNLLLVTHDSSEKIHMDASGYIKFETAGSERLRIASGGALTTTPAAGGHAVFNENGIDADFRVESDGNANMLFVDGANNRVGFGTNAPAVLVDINNTSDGTVLRLGEDGVSDWDFSIGNTSTLSGVGAGALELLPQNSGAANEFAIGQAGTTTALFHVKHTGTSVTGTLGVSGVVTASAGATITGTTNDGTTLTQITQSGTGRGLAVNRNVASATRAMVGLAQLSASGGTQAVLDIQQTTPASLAIQVTPDGSTGRFSVYGTGSLVTTPIAGSHAVFNEDGIDADFRVESDTNSNMLFVDGGNNRVGIGRNAPASIFEVHIDTNKNIGYSGGQGELGSIPALVAYTDAGSLADIGLRGTTVRFASASQERLRIDDAGVVANEGSHDADFRVESNGNANMLFVNGGNDTVTVGSSVSNANAPFLVDYNATSKFMVGGVQGGVSNNIYYNGSAWASINNAVGGAILQMGTDGAFSFRRGTAASTPSLTYSMYIDTAGYVGIGTDSPSSYYAKELVVSAAAEGGITIVGGSSDSQYLTFADGTTGTSQYRGYLQYAHSSDTLIMAAAGNAMFHLSSAETVINDQGLDHDFRVESDGNANMIRVDGGNNRIGFGFNAPAQSFAVQFTNAGRIGTFFDDGVNGASMYNGAAVLGVSRKSNGSTSLAGPLFEVGRDNSSNATYNVDHSFLTVRSDETVINEDSIDYDFRVETNGVSDALLVIGSSDRVRIGTGADLVTSSAGTSNFRAGVNAGTSIASGGNYNVVVGDEAGALISTGANNTAVGYAALASEDGNGNNTAIGWSTLKNLNAGAEGYNTAVGYDAGRNVTTGLKNTLIGSFAGNYTSTADSSTFIGYNAGLGISGALLTGNDNTAIGRNTGTLLQGAANSNVLVGAYAGNSLTTSSQNTAVGFEALSLQNAFSQNTAIGYRALKVTNGGYYNTAVGTEALSANLDGLNNTAVGHEAGLFATTADNSTFVGFQAGKGITGAKLTGNRNTAFGADAGLHLQGAASENCIFGALAGDAITTGAENCLFGMGAGGSIQTSIRNTFYGDDAGNTCTTGDSNVAIGHAAMGIGVTTGDYNIAIGHATGKLMTSGTFNTLVGGFAGDAINTGTENICIGYDSGGGINAGSNNVCIGRATANHDNTLTDGGQNIIIGDFSDVSSGSAQNQIVIGYNITASANDTFRFGKPSNTVVNTFTSDANWTQSSDERLKTNINEASLGLDFVNNLRPVTYQWKASQDLDSSDSQLEDFYNPDENLKDTDVVMHGLIAQEVKVALDTAGVDTFAGWSEDPSGVQNISREMFVIPLIKAIQEQQTLIEALTSRITTLEG